LGEIEYISLNVNLLHTNSLGDGFTYGDEECDDHNGSDNDGCTSGTIDTYWACTQTNEGCSSVCTPICGDGYIQAPETCDDGLTTGSKCNSNCIGASTGNTCKTVNTKSVCKLTTCGDGTKQAGEACDDNNGADNDGCSYSCAIEVGWTCILSGTKCY